jgi:hypothetical protein
MGKYGNVGVWEYGVCESQKFLRISGQESSYFTEVLENKYRSG